jgi:rubrerythrin
MKDFYHNGFGWICRQCEFDKEREEKEPGYLSRTFREGEAESRDPDLATKGLAKWADPARRFLTCPQCGISEDTEIH